MKLSIIGIGRVGAALAHNVVLRELADELVLVNRTHETAVGEALDLTHASSFADRRCVVRAGSIEDTAGSDAVVITSSIPTPPGGVPRTHLTEGNAALLREMVPSIAAACPDAKLVVVTNPVDTMTWLTIKLTGFDPACVIGTGTLVDSARFRTMLSAEVGIHPDDLRAYILGEHGDTQFPALSTALAGGVRIADNTLVPGVFDRTVQAGYEVFRHKGHTSYAIAGAASLIVESIALDSRRTMPVSTYIDDFDGASDVCLSLPCVIGREGIHKVLHPKFNDDERAAWQKSTSAVRSVIDRVS